jgi:hypothetical protein
MAYKFQRGTFRASGSTVVEEGVTVDTGGLTVTAGTTAVQAVTATTLSASSTLQVSGATTLGNGLTVVAGGVTVSAGGMNVTGGVQLLNGLIVVGSFAANGPTTTLGDASSDVVTVNGQITGSLFAINGGAINGTTIGATTQSSVKATTLSASSNLEVGGTATVSGITTLNSALTVSAGGLSVNSGDSSVQKLTVNGDLIVLGNTFSASVGTLLIEDAAIVVGDGSTAFGTGYGINFGSGSNQWATLLTAQDNIDGIAGNENILSSSLSIKAPAFAGTFYGTMASSVAAIGDADATLAVGVNYGSTTMTGSARTWTLPASAGLTAGQSVKVKAASGLTSTRTITIARAGSQTIDGETFITLESDYAAVELVYVTTDTWRVF